MKRINIKTFPNSRKECVRENLEYVDRERQYFKIEHYRKNEVDNWHRDFEADVRRKYEATKKMGLHERELWLSRLVVGILTDVPERILKIIDNYWEELLKE